MTTPIGNNDTPTPQVPARDPVAVARVVNLSWHVRQVLEDWRNPERVVFDEEWFRQHGRTAVTR